MTDSARSRPSNYSHLAIGVSDMDESLRFYRDTIGLDVAKDVIEDFRHLADFATLRRGVYLRWADGDGEAFLVLDQTLSDHGDRGKAKELFTIGMHHFGFWVDDTDSIVERARAAGHVVLIEPATGDTKDYGEAGGRAIRTAMIRDPDGNIVQLDQRMS
ncbi:MAG: VOC family protein [Novosphingobium sp.]|nr:VOC family protein [Novosphingobium sp.]